MGISVTRKILAIIIAITILVVGVIIGQNADKIFNSRYKGNITVNVEMNEKQKNELVKTAYEYLQEKELLEEYDIKKDDPVTIKKDSSYGPRNLGALTSTWSIDNLSVYVIDFKKGSPVVISQSTGEAIGLQLTIID